MTPSAVSRWLGAPMLGEIIADRDNNFDLIRLVAALLVLWGHASLVTQTDDTISDPFFWASDGREYSGSTAVHAFFLISGILITASLERHRSVVAFLVSRFARLWPGFVVCVAVLIYLVLPVVSGIPLLDRAHLKAAGVCLRDSMYFPVSGYCSLLPHAFPRNPLQENFGFPYWTLIAETDCYLVVAVLGFLFQGALTTSRTRTALWMASTGFLMAAFAVLSLHPPGEDSRYHLDFAPQGGYSVSPVLFFICGMALYGVRDRIPVSMPVAVLFGALVFVPPISAVMIYVALGYGVLALAGYRPLNRLRPKHDLSFGFYIYGAAMQQVAVCALGRTVPWVNVLGAGALSFVFALASWRFVEAPSIRAGRAVVRVLAGLRPVRPRAARPVTAPGGRSAAG